MSNRRYNQFYFTPHKKAVQVDCNFIVDSTNGNGLGIRSLKSPGSAIAGVFMNTSASFTGTTHTGTNVVDGISGGTSSLAVGMRVQTTDLVDPTTILSITSSSAITLSRTATTGHAGATITYQGAGSPNPASGLIMVQLADNFNRYFFGTSGYVVPVSGSAILVTTGTTRGLAYTIVLVGTTTLAQWQKLGLPVGITPAVGVTFVAIDTTTATGTGAIEVPAATGAGAMYYIAAIGDPNTTIMSTAGAILGKANGSQIILGCYGATDASTTTAVLKAPADGSVIGMSFVFSSSTLAAVNAD